MIYDKLVTKEDAATICLHGKRVPRNVNTMDASELLAEHLFDWKSNNAQKMNEYTLESEIWPPLKQKLEEATGVLI